MDNYAYKNHIPVMFADASHTKYAEHICQLIYESALQRGTGIAKRSPEYISEKILDQGKHIIASNIAHLDIELGELKLPVSARILVPVASRYLEVLVEA